MSTAIIDTLLGDGHERDNLIALCITKPDIAQGIVNGEQYMNREILLQILQQNTTGHVVKTAEDQSDDICTDIYQPFNTLPMTNAEIRASLRTPLPVRIPLERGHLPPMTPQYIRDSIATNRVNYTAYDLQELIEPLLTPNRESMWAMGGGSKHAQQTIWDKLITSVHLTFANAAQNSGIRMEFDRNSLTTDDTTELDVGSDFLWLFKKVPLFRGEERPSQGELEDAVNANQRKISWHALIYGAELPYVMSYATAGGLICFYVMRRGSTHCEAVTNVLNVVSPSDRLEVVFCVMNIMRLCLTLSPLCPSDALSVGRQFVTSTGYVTITESFVLKVIRITGSAHLTDVDTLRQLYSDLETHNVPCTVRAEDISVNEWDDSLHLKLTPLGQQVYPSSEAELKACIRCLLRALVALHKLGWVHRDIRWPNVLRTVRGGGSGAVSGGGGGGGSGSGGGGGDSGGAAADGSVVGDGYGGAAGSEWILCDFENSDRENTHVTWNNDSLPVEVLNGAPYLRSADMYQIGELLAHPRLSLIFMDAHFSSSSSSLAIRAFRDRCLDSDPSKRPTAEQALQDPWLLSMVEVVH